MFNGFNRECVQKIRLICRRKGGGIPLMKFDPKMSSKTV